MSRALLAGRIDTQPALDKIHRSVVGPLGHPADLAAWCYVWEGLDPEDYHTLSASKAQSAALRLAAAWAGYRPWPGR